MPFMTTPVLWSSPSRDNPRPKAPPERNMSNLDNRSFGENVLERTADQRWQGRLLYQSKYPKTSLQGKVHDRLLLAGQSSTPSPEENSRTNFQTLVGVPYPLTAPEKTICQDYFAGSGATTGDQAHNQSLLSEENAHTSFCARILEATAPSLSASSALQARSENNYSEMSFNPAGFTNSHLHLGLNNNNNPADTSNSRCIDIMTTIRSNLSPPSFLQSHVEPSRHETASRVAKYKTTQGSKFFRHRGESFSGGMAVSPWHKRLPYNYSNELSSIPYRSIPLSTPEVFRSKGQKSEPETFPKTVPEVSANFLLQRSFLTEAIPSVTVVLEDRSICQRICLQEHTNYDTFAQALRGMFADGMLTDDQEINYAEDCNLANAIPGHLIAYEDIEGDLLLAGDLSWKDFVRAAKRIRILPAKNPQGRVRER